MSEGADSVVVTRSLFQVTNGSPILTSAHQLRLEIVSKNLAARCYKKWHYLGNEGFMGTHNFGVYFNSELVGCITYGGMSAPDMKGLYTRDSQAGFWEIKRLALSPICPKNSESRTIAISMKLLRKFEDVKAVITYADTKVGHTGIIYRASGFEYRGLTAQKSDFFMDGINVGQKRGMKTSKLEGEWRPRSRKHLFVKLF